MISPPVNIMRLRRAVLQIPAKSSVPLRLPFHKNRSLLTPSQSTLPQLLIPLHFNSFRSNAYKKPRGRGQGRGPAANPKFFQLVTRHAPRLRTRRNPRNPNPLICLLHNSRTAGVVVPGQGYRRTPRRRLLPIQSHFISRSLLFSVPSVISRLKSPFHSVPISARTRKPSPLRLPLLTTHSHPYFITSLPGPPAKIRAANSIGAIHV